MDTVFFMLACCLSLSFAVPTTDKLSLEKKSTLTGPGVRYTTTTTTSVNSSVLETTANWTTDTMVLTSTTEDNNTLTAVTNSSQTQKNTATVMPLTNSTSTTSITVNQTPALTSVNHTEALTSVTTVAPNVTTDKTTSLSVHSTQGLRLSISERNLTITFSLMLSFFALALVVITIHRCSHKVQYLHQPLNNTDHLNAFTADPDNLIISGGLYEGHPIYDNVPPPTIQDESQFRLEFLH